MLYERNNKREFPCGYCKEVLENIGLQNLKAKCKSSTCIAINMEKLFLDVAFRHLFEEHPELLT